ncbi:MAG: hypothetical protein ABIL09_05220, partial [Gemmatimonadota bacterium]
MPMPREFSDGRAADANIPFESGYGLTAKSRPTTPLLFLRDRGLGLRSQAIDMAGATHTLVVNADASTAQTRIDGAILLVDPNTGTRSLIFPAEADIDDLFVWVVNTGGAGEIVNIQNDTPATVVSVPSGDYALVTCDGTTMRGVLFSGSTGFFTSIDLDGPLDQDAVLAAAGTMSDMALTNSIATGNSYGLYVHAEQITNARTAGALTGLQVDVTGLATDASAVNCVYRALALNADKATGTSTMSGIIFDAGWDSILDISACATGEADVIMAANLASAMAWRVAAVDFMSLDTSTGVWALDLDASLDQNYTLTAAGTLADMNLAFNSATGDSIALAVHNVQTTARSANNAYGVQVNMTSLVGDTNSPEYNNLDLNVTDGGAATATHNAINFGAGFDSIMDLTACATGEAAVRLHSNTASAMSWSVSSVDLMSLDSSNGAWALDLDATLDLDYSLGTTGNYAAVSGVAIGAAAGLNNYGLRVDVAQNTNPKDAGEIGGVFVTLTSLASDVNTPTYADFIAASPTDGGAVTAVHTALKVGDLHDYTIDTVDVATGLNVWRVRGNIADALTFTDNVGVPLNYLRLVTTTGSEAVQVFQNLDLDDILDQDVTLTGTGDAYNLALTANHATQSMEGIDVVATQLAATQRTGGVVTALKGSVVSSTTADTAGASYRAFEAQCTQNSALAIHSGLYVGDGFDYVLDLTGVTTGNGVVGLAANLASAMSW